MPFAGDELLPRAGSVMENSVMDTDIISIRVDAEAAKTFKSLSEEDRRKLEALLSIRLSEVTQRGESLEAVMNEISEKAKERGVDSRDSEFPP
jgi:hypothetical protein